MYNLFPYAIIQRMKSNEWFHLGLLILTALIWGMAFVAQLAGRPSNSASIYPHFIKKSFKQRTKETIALSRILLWVLSF